MLVRWLFLGSLAVLGCGSQMMSPPPLPDASGLVTLPPTPDGGVPQAPDTPLAGKVVLPPNIPVQMTSLKVMAMAGETTPDPEGKFTVTGAGATRQGLMLLDQDDHLLMVGFGKMGTDNAITTTTTATFYLMLFGGAMLLPPKAWDQAVDRFINAAETKEFAQFLDGKIAANPAFLELASEADKLAMAQAVGKTLVKMVPQVGKIMQSLVLVNPGDSKSGVTVLIGDKDQNPVSDINQITFKNDYRRRLYAFIDRQVGQGDTYVKEKGFELPPTNGLNGALGSVGDVIMGNGAYTPAYYGPVGLGSVLTDDEELHYRVRVLGNGQPAPWVKLTPEQESELHFVTVKNMLVDMFLPAFFALLNFDWLGGAFASPAFGDFIVQVVQNVYNGNLISVGNYLSKGDMMQAVGQFATILSQDQMVRSWILEQFRIWIIKTFNNEKWWKFSFAASGKLLVALSIVDKVLAVVDYYAVAGDGVKSNSVEDWYVTVRAPKVLLSPAKAKLSCGEKTTFTASLKNGGQKLTGDFIYKFTNTAKYGHLTTKQNNTYMDNFEVTMPDVSYTVNPGDPPDGAIDTIGVEIWLVTESADDKKKKIKQYIGKAQAQAEMHKECVNTFGYVGSGAYTSGCTGALSIPTMVYPGTDVTVTAQAGGGICSGASVWMSFATSAKLDGQSAGKLYTSSIYDFCYSGDPQPMVPPGFGVALPDDKAHTITFHIDDQIKCPICVKEISNGVPCYSNLGNRWNVSGPAVVMGGGGGTHGWSTVRFFTVGLK